jgi:hypothetical protein
MLLDLFYRILKEYGIHYTSIRAGRLSRPQLSLWDKRPAAFSGRKL